MTSRTSPHIWSRSCSMRGRTWTATHTASEGAAAFSGSAVILIIFFYCEKLMGLANGANAQYRASSLFSWHRDSIPFNTNCHR